MKESKKQYRIGHVAQEVGVEKFVIRFWEKEFNLSSTRSLGGQRFYFTRDIDNFKRIKSLLYDQGLTIAGARKFLENRDSTQIVISASSKTTMSDAEDNKIPKKFFDQLLALKKQLNKLRDIL